MKHKIEKRVNYSKIKSRRYHFQVYFPIDTNIMVAKFIRELPFIKVTSHAIDEMKNDKFGSIPLPSVKDIFNQDNILIEYYEPIVRNKPSGYIQKMLLRVKHLSDEYDYSYLIAREGFIVSAWANKKNDNHKLTKSNQYFTPEIKNDNTISINRQQLDFQS